MPDAEGVASYSAVKLPVWLAKTVFCHAPAAVVVTHTGVLLTVRPTIAVWLVLPLVPVVVRVEVLCGAVLLAGVGTGSRTRAFPQPPPHLGVAPPRRPPAPR